MAKQVEITKERIQKFWEKCGLLQRLRKAYGKGGYNVPPIDLNNLFKIAWDLAVAKIGNGDKEIGRSLLFREWQNLIDGGEDPDMALFLVIEKVI